jgi:hypothetical protein
MNHTLQRYIDLYKEGADLTYLETNRFQVCGAEITVTVSDDDHPRRYRVTADILLKKDGCRYECEGVDRNRWDFYPVTVNGKPCILFSKTLYGFTLLDAETLTEITDFFPEKVMNGEESFIVTHAGSFGGYLIFEGCYWGCDSIYAAYEPATHRFLNLSQAYGILPGDHYAQMWGGSLHLLGDTPDKETYEVKIKETDISSLMTERGTTDF